MPTPEMLDDYYDKILATFPEDIKDLNRKYEISFAEAKDYALTSVKSLLIKKLEQQELSKVTD